MIVNNLGLPWDFYGCLFMNCTIVLFTFVSIFNLVAIALERFVAITFPILHRTRFNLKIIGLMIAIAWGCGIFVGFIPLMGWHKDPPLSELYGCSFLSVIYFEYLVYFIFFGFFLIPLCAIYLTYAYIFYVIFKRGRSMAASGNADKDQKQSLKRESKAAQRIFIVVVVFTFCWLPIHIMNCISFFNNLFNLDAIILGILLSHANSAVNPFLYAWGNTKIREAMLKTLHIRSRAVHPAGANNSTVVASTT